MNKSELIEGERKKKQSHLPKRECVTNFTERREGEGEGGRLLMGGGAGCFHVGLRNKKIITCFIFFFLVTFFNFFCKNIYLKTLAFYVNLAFFWNGILQLLGLCHYENTSTYTQYVGKFHAHPQDTHSTITMKRKSFISIFEQTIILESLQVVT